MRGALLAGMGPTAALLPDPLYMIVPVCATFGGLLRSGWMLRRGQHADLPRAWLIGNIGGSAFGTLLLLTLTFLELS
jgi:hypothetical protein